MTPLADGGIALPHGTVVMEAPGFALKSEGAPALIDVPTGVAAEGMTIHTVTLPVSLADLREFRAGETILLENQGLSLRITTPGEIHHQASQTRISLTLPQEP